MPIYIFNTNLNGFRVSFVSCNLNKCKTKFFKNLLTKSCIASYKVSKVEFCFVVKTVLSLKRSKIFELTLKLKNTTKLDY